MAFRTWTLWIFIGIAIFSATGKARSAVTISATSNHFDVSSFAEGPEASKVTQLCEELREELRRVWGGSYEAEPWLPRCEIVIHPTRLSYTAVVGPGSEQTTGCSLIELEAGNVTRRRIDLLVDSSGSLPALPHELTHVVLADFFEGRQPPHWLDEGLAMLADTHEKQALHARDCQIAMLSGGALSIETILRLQQFSSPHQMPAFYGQSLLLIQMLSEKDKPSRLVPFAIDSLDHGIEHALSIHYGVNSIHALQREWRQYAISKFNRHAPAKIVSVRFQPR